MSLPGPEWNPVAFKEWSLVCDAIAEGQQSIILRKGGIAEGRSGFQWDHRRFFLFPTHFHEQEDKIRVHPEKPVAAKDGTIELELYVETLQTGRLTDWNEIRRLESFHIWSEETIRERFEWGDEPGISYAMIQAKRLIEPIVLKDGPEFGGCRSWVDLPAGKTEQALSLIDSAAEVQIFCGSPNWLE